MTHPTQYHAPWFRALANRSEISIHVFYGFQPSPELQGRDFGVNFEWDVPLLEGYPNSFLRNVATTPGWGFSDTDTPELAELIPQRNFDVWLINGWATKSEWLAVRTCYRSRIPMLIRGDSTLIDHRPLGTRIAKRLVLGKWIPRFTRYLTVGKLNEEYYEFYGADRRRFIPVRHFVDNDWFAAQAGAARARRDEIRASWQIAPDALVFLFAGKLIDKKQPMLALDAFRRVSAGRTGLHLLIAGDGALREQCERYAQDHRLSVTFAGFLNQGGMPNAYAASDVLVLPSARQETWGLVVNEAMASGLPAIVSDKVGCAPDLVSPGETGDVFPSGNSEALAAAMDRLAGSAGRLVELGNTARERIRHYSLDAATDNTVTAILDASAGRQ